MYCMPVLQEQRRRKEGRNEGRKEGREGRKRGKISLMYSTYCMRREREEKRNVRGRRRLGE